MVVSQHRQESAGGVPAPAAAAAAAGRIGALALAPVHVVFLVRGLHRGGAERQLVELLRRLPPDFRVTLITFYAGGALSADVRALSHVTLVSLDKRGRWDVVPFLWRARRATRRARPHVVHGWLGMANLLALVLGRLNGAAVMWGVRSAFMDMAHYDWLIRLEYWLARRCVGLADGVVFNSYAGLAGMAAQPERREVRLVVPNGIDTDRFRPDAAARQRQRQAWAVDRQPVVVLVGRIDPMKDHPTFLRAAALVAAARKDVRFVCVGSGNDAAGLALRGMAQELGLADRLRWEPERADVEAVYNAADLVVLSSYGEGFPNVLAEALACGTACVTTNVGDAALLVTDPQRVVPPRSPEQLAAAIQRALAADDAPAAASARRQHVANRFAAESLGDRYANAIRTVLARRRAEVQRVL